MATGVRSEGSHHARGEAQAGTGSDRIAGSTFELDHHVEDATFFADLRIKRPGPPGFIVNVIAVRFSSFGSLFTTFSNYASSQPERLPEGVEAELVQTVSEAGFVYVSEGALETPYTGTHPHFVGSTWWDRFFDYT